MDDTRFIPPMDPDAGALASQAAAPPDLDTWTADLYPEQYQIRPELQPRAGTSEAWIEQIRQGLENGRTQERLLLALITDPENAPDDLDPDRPVLVDGAHRHTAIRRLARSHVRVTVERMTWGEAMIRAAEENGRNGQPLDQDGIREWARRLWLYSQKSQSGIAKAVGVNPSTITRWARDWEAAGEERENAGEEKRGRPRSLATPGQLAPDVRRALARLGSLSYQMEIADRILAHDEPILTDAQPANGTHGHSARRQFEQISQRIRKRHDAGGLIAAIRITRDALAQEAQALAEEAAQTRAQAEERRRQAARAAYTAQPQQDPAPQQPQDPTPEPEEEPRLATFSETLALLKGLACRAASKAAKSGGERARWIAYGEAIDAVTPQELAQAARDGLDLDLDTLAEARRELREIWIDEQPPALAADPTPEPEEEEEPARVLSAAEQRQPGENDQEIQRKIRDAEQLEARLIEIRRLLTAGVTTSKGRKEPDQLYLEITGRADWRLAANNHIVPRVDDMLNAVRAFLSIQ